MTLVVQLEKLTKADHDSAVKFHDAQYKHIMKYQDKALDTKNPHFKDWMRIASQHQQKSLHHGIQSMKANYAKDEALISNGFSDPLGPGEGSPIHQSDPHRSMFYHQSMYNKLQAHAKEPHVIANDVKTGIIAKEMNHHAKMYHAHKRHADQQQQGTKK